MTVIKEILFGTTNEAKIKQFQSALAPIGVQVRGVGDGVSLPEIEEDGQTAQENARKKAVAYAKALGQAVVSMDNALYFDKLPAEEQPGLHVRRISARTSRLTDEEMRDHYSALVLALSKPEQSEVLGQSFFRFRS